MYLSGLVAGCIFLVVSATAHARCTAQIASDVRGHQIIQANYDVFSAKGLLKPLAVEIRRVDDGNEPCDFILRINSEGESQLYGAGGNTLAFRLMSYERQTTRNNNEVSANLTAQEPDNLLRFDYLLVIEGQQFVPPGIYQAEINIGIVSDAADSPVRAQQVLSLSVEVKAAARISFAGTQGRQQLANFGELSDGKQVLPPPLITVQSTGSFALQISSIHKGHLRHHSGNPAWDIPYTTVIGDTAVDLSTKMAELQFYQSTSLSGSQFPLLLTVPQVGQRPSGNYEDVLRISIFPGELYN